MVYFGFDLGDGESCIHWSRGMDSDVIPVPIGGYNSFISAVSEYNGQPLIGHTVLGNLGNVEGASVCFKRHFLENRPEYDAVILRFVRGVMAELRRNPDVSPFVDDDVNTCFVVGCPAGWKEEDRSRYRELMIRAGMKNVRIVSESRAAFENALKGFGRDHIDPDYKKQAVLVIDIGSSTLDFAYVKDGNEYEVSTLGNVMLGGGLMDEMLVMRSLEVQERSQPDTVREIRKLIEEDEAKKGKLMLAVRDLKEIYFNEENYYLSSNQTLSNTKKLIGNGKVYRVELMISPAIVEDYLISRPHPLLDNRSFETCLRNSLADVYNKTIERKEPDVVILTGGPSRMNFFVELCRKQFRNSTVLISPKPEYDISRGLVLIGKADEMMGRAIADIRRYVESDAVENMTAEMIPGLVDSIAEPLADRVMEQCVIPVFRQWKNREIDTLNQFQDMARQEMEKYLRSGTMQSEMAGWIQPWSDSVIDKVEADIMEICSKYKVSIFLRRDRLIITAKGNSSGPA
ncbi:MAG: Hsp70 family protein, partial [Lachnospiraceae bacterium]|nr:Hsp70 family protein [Lachnospiraceae bacterium]